MNYLNGKKIVLATHNKGKVKEFYDIFENFDVDVSNALDLKIDDVEETGNSFSENSLIKARHVACKTGFVSVADDSGLCIDILNNWPGIYSARYAGEDKDFNLAMKKLYKEILKVRADAFEREENFVKAQFICALAVVFPDIKKEYTFVGNVSGHITWPPRGKKGFGYDPFFIAGGYNVTFGEMDPFEKHMISHRFKAFKLLKKRLFK